MGICPARAGLSMAASPQSHRALLCFPSRRYAGILRPGQGLLPTLSSWMSPSSLSFNRHLSKNDCPIFTSSSDLLSFSLSLNPITNWSCPLQSQHVLTHWLLHRLPPASAPRAQRVALPATQVSRARNTVATPDGQQLPCLIMSEGGGTQLLNFSSSPMSFLRLDVHHLFLELLLKLPHQAPCVWPSSPTILLPCPIQCPRPAKKL